MKLSTLYTTLKFMFSWPLAFVSILFLIFALSKQKISFADMLFRVDPRFIALSLACFTMYFLLRNIVWYCILKTKTPSITAEKSAYIWGISELKRFIPGNFWAFLGRGILLSAEGLTKKQIFHVLILEVEFFVIACIAVSILAIPFLQKIAFFSLIFFNGFEIMFVILVVLIASFFIFHKSFISLLPKRIARVISPIFPGFDSGFMLALTLLSVLYLLFFGIGVYFAVLSVVFLSPLLIVTFISFFVFALFFGYITLLTPMGLGVREGVISLGLSSYIGFGTGVFVAILARILQIVSELIFLLFVLLWYKNKKIQAMVDYVIFHKELMILGCFVVLYALYFLTSGLLRYDNFFTGRFDLGNMDQTVWNSLHGRFFQFTDPNGTYISSRLAFHADFILVLLAPLYFLWSDPRMLILTQTLVVACGALFLYFISLHILKKPTIALCIVTAYLLNPSLSYSLLYDFHPVVLSTGLLLATYYYFLKKKYILFFVFLILSALTKEEVWIIAAFLGARLALHGITFHKKRLSISKISVFLMGIGTFLVSLGVFYILISHIIPKTRGDVHFALSYYSHLGSTPKNILLSLILAPQGWLQLIFAPERITYLLSIFSPVAFLPLFSLPTLLFALPDLAINMLSNNGQLHEIYYQYTATITPFLFIATGYGIKTIQKRFTFIRDSWMIAVLTVSAIVSAYILGPLPGSLKPNIDMYTKQLANRAEISRFLATIDPKKSVAASNNLGSHVSQREKIYTIPNGLSQADVVAFLLNDTYAQPSLQAQKQMVTRLRQNPSYRIVFESGEFIAFLHLKNAIILR